MMYVLFVYLCVVGNLFVNIYVDSVVIMILNSMMIDVWFVGMCVRLYWMSRLFDVIVMLIVVMISVVMLSWLFVGMVGSFLNSDVIVLNIVVLLNSVVVCIFVCILGSLWFVLIMSMLFIVKFSLVVRLVYLVGLVGSGKLSFGDYSISIVLLIDSVVSFVLV